MYATRVVDSRLNRAHSALHLPVVSRHHCITAALCQRELAQTGQLPSILLVPTNAVLGEYLTAMRILAAAEAAAAAGAGSNSGGSTTQDTAGALADLRGLTLEQLVDDFNTDSTADSLMLLRRHCECWLLSVKVTLGLPAVPAGAQACRAVPCHAVQHFRPSSVQECCCIAAA